MLDETVKTNDFLYFVLLNSNAAFMIVKADFTFRIASVLGFLTDSKTDCRHLLLDSLPQKLSHIGIDCTHTRKAFSLLFVPEALVHINLTNNLFEMDTVIFSCAHRRLLRADLRGNKVQSVADTNEEYLVLDKFL